MRVPLFARRLRMGMFCVVALAASFVCAAAPKSNPKCEPNPLFSLFPNSDTEECERSRFHSLQLMRWMDVPNRSDAEPFRVEGEFWTYRDEIRKDAAGRLPSNVEIRRNFENAVKQAKGTILYVNDGYGKVVYRISRNDGEFWGEAWCGAGSGQECTSIVHSFVRVAAMEQSIVVSSEQIAKSILDEGKVIFYGLYFDSDKAVLKPNSTPTLVEMAKWLKDNGATKVFIVGHTDMQGSVDHNLALSRSRAQSVVDALVKSYGIGTERLKAEGVGPYSPVASNAGDKGRAKNRRVEMVLRQ